MVRWNLAWLIIVLLFITYFFMLDFKGIFGGLSGNLLKINDFSRQSHEKLLSAFQIQHLLNAKDGGLGAFSDSAIASKSLIAFFTLAFPATQDLF